MSEVLKSRILRTDNVEWKRLKPLQAEGFKLFTPEEKERLRRSISDNDFIQPFYVWRDGKSTINYCLDGYHRILILKDLENDGIAIPELLPATFIDCDNIDEAAKLVLLYSSHYAHITPGGFEDYLRQYNLDAETLKMEISIPGISDLLKDDEMAMPDELTSDAKDKPAVMRITFTTVHDLEKAMPMIEDLLKKVAPDYMISVSAGEI